MAGHVNELGRSLRAQQAQGFRPATLARRVQQNRRGCRGKPVNQGGQRLLHLAADEFAVGAMAGGGISSRRRNGALVVFDAHERLDRVGQLQAEEADPAIQVNQMAHAAGPQRVADDRHQPGQQKEIILEERIGWAFPNLPAGCAAQP